MATGLQIQSVGVPELVVTAGEPTKKPDLLGRESPLAVSLKLIQTPCYESLMLLGDYIWTINYDANLQ